MSFSLKDPISKLKGVGEVRIRAFQKAGVTTLEELLLFFPKGYRSGRIESVSEERLDQPSTFSLTVENAPGVYTLPGGRRALRFVAKDDVGTRVHVLYFNQPYLRRQITKGDHAFYYGFLREKGGVFYLFSPVRQKEMPDPDRLIPEYPSVGGLRSKGMEALLKQFLVPCLSQIPETLPSYLIEAFQLMPRNQAIFSLHAPSNETALEKAKERLLFERLFSFSVKASLFEAKRNGAKIPGFSPVSLTPFLNEIPFSLTQAQKRVIGEIFEDMVSQTTTAPMNRLLQGDVGSGKTVVAAAAAYLTVKNGRSVAVMAPTEILAMQHHRFFSRLFHAFSVPVMLLTGSTTKKNREEIFQTCSQGEPYVLVGTHALTEEGARFSNLALAITDEQHRFGVRQRTQLSEKGDAVHTLVMSATPIPRSLAMFLHTKKKISVIDQLPAGREPVETLYVGEDKLERVYRFLQEKIRLGQQAFIVCPLIEDEEEKSPLSSATEEFRAIQAALPEVRAALIHRRMKNEEKTRVMEAFRNKEISLLVSTTVIEVGIDVPSATVMVIRSAERFGLSQLHQLRGRVGRGSEKSYCILISSHSGKNARARLKKLCSCHDGFELAKFDLETRGPGEFFGTRQSGFGDGDLKCLSMPLLQCAGDAARLFLEKASPEEIAPYEKRIGLN